MKFVAPVITLIIGLAIGAFALSGPSEGTEPAAALPDQAASPAESIDELTAEWDAERGKLQARIQELDQAVVDRDRIITKLRSEIREKPVADSDKVAATDGDDRPARQERGGRDGQDRARNLAELKERDPEAYKRMRERIEGFTDRMQTAMLNQHKFFDTLDQALMTEEQRENHVKLQETMLAVQETMDKLKQGELDNAGWETRREMMGTLRQLGPMLEMEREAALTQIGHDLGYEKPEEREQFVEYMDHVYSMTSPGTLWRSMMGDRGRRDRDRNAKDADQKPKE